MPVSTLTTTGEAKSKVAVSITTAAGEQYTHAIESELAGVNILALLVSIGLVCFLARRDYDAWNTLIRHGVVTQAVSYDKVETTGKGAATYICYSFRTDAGASAFNEKVERVEYENMRPNQLRPVTYVPGTQGHLWKQGLVSSDQRNAGVAIWILSLLGAALIWGIGIGVTRSSHRKQLHLLREGVAVPAVVRSGQVVKSSNQVSFAVQYSYWTGNKKRTGEMYLTEAHYRSVTEGNPYFTVLYDAAHPSEHLPYFQITEARFATVAAAQG